MPSATSRPMAPVGITSTGARASSPRRMIAPSPWFLRICARAVSSALSRSGAAGMGTVQLVGSGRWSRATLGRGTDISPRRRHGCGHARLMWTVVEHSFERRLDTPNGVNLRRGGADNRAMAISREAVHAFPGTPEALLAAVQTALVAEKLGITRVDPTTGVIDASAAMSVLSWGENITVRVWP